MADPGKAGIVEEDIDAVFASYLVRLKFKREKNLVDKSESKLEKNKGLLSSKKKMSKMILQWMKKNR